MKELFLVDQGCNCIWAILGRVEIRGRETRKRYEMNSICSSVSV